jgi:hypothetical protein
MKLYTRAGATSVSHAAYGTFPVEADGSVTVPDEFGKYLHGQSIAGKKAWETEGERVVRIASEKEAAKHDPAHLADLIAELTAQIEATKSQSRRGK